MRHSNHRLGKIHRNYNVEETASLYGIHQNTARESIKSGLPTTDRERPMLILGRELGAFLQARRWRSKQARRPDEIHCVRRCARSAPTRHMAASHAAGFFRLLPEWAECD